MKKIIFIATLLFAFTLTANAQQDKKTAQEYARSEATLLAQTVGLNETQTQDFYRLFEMKYQTLADNNLSIEKKKEFLNIVMMKVQATLDAGQMKKLEANTELMDRVRNGVKMK